jgi:hypothetical protein
MEEQIAITELNNPYETLYFTVGSTLLMIGLFIGTVMPDGQWKNKGITLLASGSLIAFPAVIPITMSLFGGNHDAFLMPVWLLNGVSVFGILFGAYGWLSESKKAKLNKASTVQET